MHLNSQRQHTKYANRLSINESITKLFQRGSKHEKMSLEIANDIKQ